jgi:DNA-binding NarL/FixJ family response regulator
MQTRVLIVDQQLLFREGLALLVAQQHDWVVVGEASSVQEAVRLAGQLEPNVVLTDLALPDGNGLVLARQLLSCWPSMQLVILTSDEDETCLFEAIRLGVKGYLPKNLSMRELHSYLKTVSMGEMVLTPRMVQRVMAEFARQGDCSEHANGLNRPPKSLLEPAGVQRLTRRQKDVLRELRRGASNKDIADHLVISENTVKHHVTQILSKFNCRTRRDLTKHFVEH